MFLKERLTRSCSYFKLIILIVQITADSQSPSLGSSYTHPLKRYCCTRGGFARKPYYPHFPSQILSKPVLFRGPIPGSSWFFHLPKRQSRVKCAGQRGESLWFLVASKLHSRSSARTAKGGQGERSEPGLFAACPMGL